jgi:mannose/fructose-specific phosphotransferase system component IIA
LKPNLTAAIITATVILRLICHVKDMEKEQMHKKIVQAKKKVQDAWIKLTDLQGKCR